MSARMSDDARMRNQANRKLPPQQRDYSYLGLGGGKMPGFMGALGSAMGGMGMGGMRRPQPQGMKPPQMGGIGPSQGMGNTPQGPMQGNPWNKGMGGFAQNLGQMGGMMGGMGMQKPPEMQQSPMSEVPMGNLQGSMNQMQMGQQRGDRFRQMLGGMGMQPQMVDNGWGGMMPREQAEAMRRSGAVS